MKYQELYNKLFSAYSKENMTNITQKLIELYKNKNYTAIRAIAEQIPGITEPDEINDSSCFSKLVFLYHPDKEESIKKQLKHLYQQEIFQELNSYSHILNIGDIIKQAKKNIETDIDYNPEYIWDQYNENDEADITDPEYFDYTRSFYNAIKLREYGRLDIEFPSYYLEDIENFELTDQGIQSLDGVEYCIHAKVLDLSDNEIDNLEGIWDLTQLEELYLANNQIGYIDQISNLVNLRVLDLSFNQIQDISPILKLSNLEYINIIGNNIPPGQIKELKMLDLILLH